MPPIAAARPVAADAPPVGSIGAVRSPETSAGATSVGRMVAGVVPGRINFTGAEPVQAGGALPMYRHPGDKNAAATALSAGRMIDIQG